VILLTRSISPESGPESNASLLPSLDNPPTLRGMLRLLDRESSPEEIDDDDNNGLEHLLWIPLDAESSSNSLRPSSPALKPPLLSLCLPPQSPCPMFRVPALESVSSASVREPMSPAPAPELPFPVSVLTPEPRRSKCILSVPGHYAVLAGRSPQKPRRGGNV
jgi:hypothetical protein